MLTHLGIDKEKSTRLRLAAKRSPGHLIEPPSLLLL
jgi:hypothetical protein